MTAPLPPAPIWRDPDSALAVWVNGGLIELTVEVAGGAAGCVTPAQAMRLPMAFGQAIVDACAWAKRWDGEARIYRGLAQ